MQASRAQGTHIAATASTSISTEDLSLDFPCRKLPAGDSSTQLVRSDSDLEDAEDFSEPLLPSELSGQSKSADFMHGDSDKTQGRPMHSHKDETFRQKLAKALKNPHMLLFLAKGFVMGVCVGVIDGYLFVYLDLLGAPPALLGTCLLMICCAELPVFAYSGEILNFLGYSGALHLALGAFCCRLAVYSSLHLMSTYWMVAPFEMLHGITFGIAWAAGVNYCQAVAPEGLKSTIQSVFGATYYGLGRGTGGLIGGLLLHRFGGPLLFASVLIWTCTSWAAISVAELLVVLYTS